jgi:hypothetical protein
MAERDDLPTDELLRLALEGALADVHTSCSATVVSYDAAKKRANVKLVVRNALGGDDGDALTYEEPIVIPNVPVVGLGSGGFFLSLPVEEGDAGRLHFAETDESQWEATGEVSNPRDLTRHGLGSCVFVPSPRQPPATIGAYMACPSPFSFGDPASAKLLAVAEKVDQAINDLKSVFSGWVPVPNDGGAALKTAITTWAGTPADTSCGKLKAE